VEDLCADTFAELLARDMQALRNFRGRSSLATYLGVITRRVVVRKLAEHRFLQAMGHINAHQAAVDSASTEVPAANLVEQRDQVENLFSKLPGEARKVLRWIYLDEISYREVAERLGRPLNSIGPLLSRIRKMLSITTGKPGI
jgi:RNA polymerase sigma-70 factor (ECF subfamily)